MENYPQFKAGTVFNELVYAKLKKSELIKNSVTIRFPTRLNAMVLDATRLIPNDLKVFPAGGVFISIAKPINVKTEFLGDYDGQLVIGGSTKRKALVNHAYQIMCKVLDKYPSLSIEVNDNGIIKHCGFGSSGAILGGVCSSINELFGNPLRKRDLLRYIAGNYGEEIIDDDKDNLQLVQAIGGSLSTGLIRGGIQVLVGNATPIMICSWNGEVVLAVPKDYVSKSAKELIESERKSIYENSETQVVTFLDRLSIHEDAYNMLHDGLPGLANGDISAVSDLVFDWRFNKGGISVGTCFYPGVNDIADNVRHLYENKNCAQLGMSSLGPLFYALVNNKKDRNICAETFNNQNMETESVPVCNGRYVAF